MTKNNTTPFRMPEGYLEKLESSVNEKIGRKPSRAWSVLKPAIGLACAFAVVFGMGYGVLSLTGSLNRNENVNDNEIIEYLAAEMSQSDILDYYAELEEK